MVIAINWNMLTGSAKNTVANTSPKTADKERIKDDLTTPIRIMLCKYRYRDRANPKTPNVIIGNIWSGANSSGTFKIKIVTKSIDPPIRDFN